MNAPDRAGSADTAVGIGFSRDEGSLDFEITLAYVDLSKMTEDDAKEVSKFAKENGIGRDAITSSMSVAEYPDD
jgi:hypothetical protein